MSFFSKKSCLGVDLGTAAVKIVEISREKRGLVLKNYGLTEPFDARNFRTTNLSNKDLGSLIEKVVSAMRPGTKRAVFSLPVASSFSTLMDFPPMTQEELAVAVPYEAKKFVPIPLEEVELDWSVVKTTQASKESQAPAKIENIEAAGIEKVENFDKSMEQAGETIQDEQITADNNLDSAGFGSGLNNSGRAPGQKAVVDEIKKSKSAASRKKKENDSGTLVILVAVPKEIIRKYSEVAKASGLSLLALEQEAFSLARSLVDQAKGVSLIADIGNRSTDLVVVENGFVSVTHNLETISRDLVAVEIERIVKLYKEKYNKTIERCILAGGKILAGQQDSFSESLARDWSEVLMRRFGMEVRVGDPVRKVSFHPALKNKMMELGPALAVAVGLAMREL